MKEKSKYKISIKNFFGHLKVVRRHRFKVFCLCCKIGIPFQGLTHDLSKYSPTEFWESVKYFQGDYSPIKNCKKENGYSKAWLHHKGRNKHHFEYWIDYSSSSDEYAFGCKMPLRYVGEMIADRYAACVAYNKDEYTKADAWNYYSRARDVIIMHEDTKAVLEKALTTMADEGEEAAFKYMKDILKKTKGTDYSKESLGLKEEA